MEKVNELADKISETLNLSSTPKVTLPPHLEKFSVSHSATSNAATWKEALAGNTDAPHGYLFTKTLVFKPKTAKDQAATVAMVVALEDTATSAKQVAGAVNAKDARFATADIVKEVLGVTVEQGMSD
jgi:prolyl-tRNA editing enzyme YbaK/EbsC (Cys-tRNA(Pro) deacylase)